MDLDMTEAGMAMKGGMRTTLSDERVREEEDV